MVSTSIFLTTAALSAPLVAGHGYMALPKVSFPNGGDITAPAGTIDSSQFTPPSGMSFTTDPESNTKAYTAWIKTSGYTSLKDLITKKGNIGACGNSAVADPQPLPPKVEWTHSSTEGFTPSHQGPCEIWCDDTMAFHDDNCAKDYPQAPAQLPYDASKCAGAKVLTAYWLALHSPQWQMYVNCAGLSGGSSGNSGSSATPATSSPSSSSSSTPTVTPSTTTAPSTPAATPSTASGSEDCDNDLPEPDCDDDLPEPGSDCDDLPEPGSDCDDLPEPSGSNVGGEADWPTSNIGFGTINNNGGEDSPGKVSPKQYR